jgi:hypothetical protein
LKAIVFYSWQSDTAAACNRNLILRALEEAVTEIRGDDSINVEPVVDRDTRGVAGSPDIGKTILDKIKAADVVVADVTIINPGASSRLTPNPNVLIEVGYALGMHSETRLILVQNLAFGAPEELPFDLRQKRVLTYTSAAGAADRASDRRALQASLKAAVGAVLSAPGPVARSEYPIELSMAYQIRKNTGSLHEYALLVRLKNTGTRRIGAWHLEVEMPTLLLVEPMNRHLLIPSRSNAQRTLFRMSDREGPIFPGDAKLIELAYRMNEELYRRKPELFPELIKATAYVEGQVAEEIKRPVADMQQF